MPATQHAYDEAADYWRVRAFLRAAYLLNGRRERAWSLLRWDYWRWHVHENIFQFHLAGSQARQPDQAGAQVV